MPRALPSVSAGAFQADARFGAFDFRQAYEESPPDLRELLDSHESLPFRRRGYERDGAWAERCMHARMNMRSAWVARLTGCLPQG